MNIDEKIEKIVKLIEEIDLPGYGADEVAFLTETVLRLRPDFICEWGTNRGSSARILYEASRLLPAPPTVHTIDLPPAPELPHHEHPGEQLGMFVQKLRRVRQHHGDGLRVGIELFAEAQPRRPMFFVDGDHSYSTVSSELAVLSVLEPRPVIVFHDTNHAIFPLPTGPSRALHEFKLARRSYRMTELLSQAGMVRLWPK